MIGPLTDPPLWLALVVGVAFGAILEQAGLGSARTIAAQLAGRDFTVVKVMLVAIVTAMLGVFWSARLGWLDLRQVGIPATDLLPQLAGAVVFGAGFAIASLCPGTACVAAGSGRADGLAAIVGLFLGTLGIGLAWPRLGPLAEWAPREAARLPADLGLPTGVVVALITIMAVLVIPWLARFEAPGPGRGESIRLSPLAAAALALGVLAIPAAGSSRGTAVDSLEAIAREIASEADHVEAIELAGWIREGRRGLRIIDVREGLTADDYLIPGAELVPLAMIPRLELAADEVVVLYSEGGAHAAQAWVLLRAQGVSDVLVLHDGMAAWEDEVMSPAPPITTDSAALARFAPIAELSAWFGGAPRPEPPPGSRQRSTPVRRRNTC